MRDSAAASAVAVNAKSLVHGSLEDRPLRVGQPEPGTAATTNLSALYPALMDADDRGDARALARIGWVLFATASAAQLAHDDAVGLVEELRLAARVAAAGEGSPASLALLRRVLGRHGWLPHPGATPLQVLAGPVKLVHVSRSSSVVANELRSEHSRLRRRRLRGIGVIKGGIRITEQGERPRLMERGLHPVENGGYPPPEIGGLSRLPAGESELAQPK
jgi:hypothetical protein